METGFHFTPMAAGYLMYAVKGLSHGHVRTFPIRPFHRMYKAMFAILPIALQTDFS